MVHGDGPFLAAALSLHEAPVLNPATYRSITDAFTLEVDPSEPDGSGAARYRLTRHGETVWEREHLSGRKDEGTREAAIDKKILRDIPSAR